jgi:DNA-directed RNA polymerase subunit M/transcription elongation factor TFIIS
MSSFSSSSNNITSEVLKEYKTLLYNKYNNKGKYSSNDIVDYLYSNNDSNTFLHKMYDILSALDISDNKYIYDLLEDLEALNSSDTFSMCPDINQPIYDEIKKRKSAENNSVKYFNTDFTCKKCKHNNTTIMFVIKHLGMDEASSMKITCVNCKNEWYN